VVAAAAADLTLVTLPVTLQAQIGRRQLPPLRESGPLGALLARQIEVHAEDHHMPDLGGAHAGLLDDLANFMYDPVAAAVAAGWDVARLEPRRLRAEVAADGVLQWLPDPGGGEFQVVVDIDSAAFMEQWSAAVGRADRGEQRGSMSGQRDRRGAS
jgi:hypothetical protein